MPTQRDLHDFGSLFSTSTALAAPFGATAGSQRFERAAPTIGGLGPRDAVRRLIDLLIDWQERARQRRALAALSDHMLRDIGLSRTDVTIEANKPFWRP